MDISPIGERADILDTARCFDKVVDLIVRMACGETTLGRVGEMIRADTRKINAIKEARLPALKADIRSIERTLEEREKEDIFRLKVFKKRIFGQEGIKPRRGKKTAGR